MLVYKAGLPKKELLPQKLPFEDPFLVGSVNRMLMFKNDRHIGRIAQTSDKRHNQLFASDLLVSTKCHKLGPEPLTGRPKLVH